MMKSRDNMSEDNLNNESPIEEFRTALLDQLRRELVGPDLPIGEDIERIDESPRQRYSAGILFPARELNTENEDDAESINENADDLEKIGPGFDSGQEARKKSKRIGAENTDCEQDDTITMANTYMPSAMGVSFFSDYISKGLKVTPKAAIYETQKRKEEDKEFTDWVRNPININPVNISFDMPAGKDIKVDTIELYKDLKLRVTVRARKDGSYLLTISIYNSKVFSGEGVVQASDCFYQVGFRVESDSNENIIRPYQEMTIQSDDMEEESLSLLFRNRVSYGVGHGCAVNWGGCTDERTIYIETDSLPFLKIPPVEPRQIGGDELSMIILSGGVDGSNEHRVPDVLEGLISDYSVWIDDALKEISQLKSEHHIAAKRHLSSCTDACDRMKEGIAILRENELALQAFCLANKAMLMQQYHSRRKTRSLNGAWEDLPSSYEPGENWMGRWRTFQIAFFLMNIGGVTLTDEGNYRPERDVVDLIWFPTGGGKTEAYLGLAAYTLFLRRLKEPSNSGCTVLMRYTLRLLTAQQFQRASALICACESIRQKKSDELGRGKETAVNKFQLLKCPWCGTRLDEKGHLGYRAMGSTPKTVLFICPEKKCDFNNKNNPLPVQVIDDDIYDSPPSLLIGTVDKFAMLAWRSEATGLFGIKNKITPPELIIQDELHLISGPLGTMVGLYEGVIDLLCRHNGSGPKIVGSTATIRRAPEQCKALYDRKTFQFPPPGLDISDSFFAFENQSATGRIYVGVFPTASPSFVTALNRTTSSLLQGCRTIDLPDEVDESIRNPYWTLVQYFNSLRELGRALTLLQADIPEYMWAIVSRSKIPKEKVRTLYNFDELTSRKSAQEIPEILEDLNINYPPDSSGHPKPLDVLLATNMISVGVDVDRLGLMCIVGQPKTTSEYIQASSRVGRSKEAPGLVVTMYNPGKPRDRSHFEQFRTYHSSLYRYVEPTSVTPYSIPVLERALHPVLVIIGRHLAGWTDPGQIDFDEGIAKDAISFLVDRCKNIDEEHIDVFKSHISKLITEWEQSEAEKWGGFGEPDPYALPPLMYPAGSTPLPDWGDQEPPWATPSSMRSVDSECQAEVIQDYPV
jgi:hypothetical protein